MIISYPTLIQNDAGAPVSGATATIASVTDVDGTAIVSPGATVSLAGPVATVKYDPETKGEALITLTVSKTGQTFTGFNAAPIVFAARDSSRLGNSLPSAAAGVVGGLPLSVDSAGKVAIGTDGILAGSVSTAAKDKIQNGLATGADAATIQGYVDTLETTQVTIAGYTDSLEASQTALAAAVTSLPNATRDALKADTEWKTILAGVNGAFTFNPTTGVLVLKDKTGTTTFATLTVTKNGDGIPTARTSA